MPGKGCRSVRDLGDVDVVGPRTGDGGYLNVINEEGGVAGPRGVDRATDIKDETAQPLKGVEVDGMGGP